MGPSPPSGTHHYHFKIYALDAMLELEIDPDKKAIESAIPIHLLATGELVGIYTREKSK